MNWKIILSEPAIGTEEIEAVTDVLKSKWLTLGDVTRQFEKEFAEKLGCKHAFFVSSCTAALHLAAIAAELKETDEAICPALTFVATANAIRYMGAEVVFADVISEKDLTIDPKDIEQKITDKTRAIFVVHYAGFPCNMEEIMAIAKKHNLYVIEDTAHAPFVQYRGKEFNGKSLGTIGDIGCFSFYGNKNMTTGEGGMITTDDDALAEKIRLARSHGMTSLTLERHKGHASGYDVTTLGYNYRADEIRAAIGLCQLQKIDDLNQKRRNVVSLYRKALQQNPNVIIPFEDVDVTSSSCHIMPVILKTAYNETKEKLKQAGVQTSKHYDIIPTFSDFSKYSFESKTDLLDNILTLPLHQNMTEDDVTFIAEIMNSL